MAHENPDFPNVCQPRRLVFFCLCHRGRFDRVPESHLESSTLPCAVPAPGNTLKFCLLQHNLLVEHSRAGLLLKGWTLLLISTADCAANGAQ